MNRHTTRRLASHASKFFESLEGRRMMSVTSDFDPSSGELTIYGTPQADNIQVNPTPDGTAAVVTNFGQLIQTRDDGDNSLRDSIPLLNAAGQKNIKKIYIFGRDSVTKSVLLGL